MRSKLIAGGLAAAFVLAAPLAAPATEDDRVRYVYVGKRPVAKPRKPRMHRPLPPPMYKAMPMRPAAPAWTGAYAGVSFAARWAATDWTTNAILPPPIGTTPAVLSFDTEMFRAGGYLGYNWQVGRSVIGLEADFGWADKTRTIGGIPGTYTPAGAAAARANDSSSVNLGWDAGVRGRLGVLIAPEWLVYGTVGVAWQHMEIGASCTLAGGYCSALRAETHDSTRLGWTVGAGVEGLFVGNWLARAEYRYADFERARHTFFAGTGDDVFAHVKIRTHTALLGLAYKFGAEAAPWPVTARY